MLGAGHTPVARKLKTKDSAEESNTLWTTLDINPEAHPDVIFDLSRIETGEQLPFPCDRFDEIHAYEVMEHYGRQGDFRGFFAGFRELWRVLKPGGMLIGTAPSLRSPWLWGDPGHTRVIAHEVVAFLDRRMYDGIGSTPATDYKRFVDPCWWEIQESTSIGDFYQFALKKVA
jgi:SAM-dependent methyltransferase